MARKSLTTALVTKAEQLRTEELRQADASVQFIEASRRAEEAQLVAGNHAKAVEQALNILAEAGVVL